MEGPVNELKISRVPLQKSFLLGLTEIERRLFLLCGQLIFELNILNKMRLWTLGFASDPKDVNRHATVMQSEYFAKLLGATLFEGWECLKKDLHNSGARHVVDALSAEAVESHGRLKKIFGKGTKLNKVRNVLAFHYNPKNSAASLEELIASDPNMQELVLGGILSNTVLTPSMYSAWFALARQYHPTDVQQGLEAFGAEVHKVFPELQTLAEGVILMLIERDLGKNWGAAGIEEELTDVPLLSDIKIPFFIRPDL